MMWYITHKKKSEIRTSPLCKGWQPVWPPGFLWTVLLILIALHHSMSTSWQNLTLLTHHWQEAEKHKWTQDCYVKYLFLITTRWSCNYRTQKQTAALYRHLFTDLMVFPLFAEKFSHLAPQNPPPDTKKNSMWTLNSRVQQNTENAKHATSQSVATATSLI